MINPSDSYGKFTSLAAGMDSIQKIIEKTSFLKSNGKKIIDCGLGEPSHGLLKPAITAGVKALRSGEHGYVRPTHGLSDLRLEIAKNLSNELGRKISFEQIVVTPGAELGLDLLFRTFLNPGDEVIIFDPFFIPFAAFVMAYGARPVLVETYSTNFNPNIEMMISKITRKTKAIILNSPNNPTGRIIEKKLMKEMVEIARKKDLLIISDECYKYFDYENKFCSPYSIYPESTIVVRSFSKEYSMMGFKVGYIIASKRIVGYIKTLQFPGWGAPRISSLIAYESLRHKMTHKILEEYKKKRDLLYRSFVNLNLTSYLPEGAFYYYLKSPDGDNLKFALRLAEEGLIVMPAFSSRNTHVRLSFGSINRQETFEVIKIFEKLVKS